MDSLEEAAIGVPALLEIGVSVLPVDVPRELLCHGLDEIDLVVEILLQFGFDGCVIDLEVVEIEVGSLYFHVGRVPLQESCSSMLFYQCFESIGINIEIVHALLCQFLVIIGMGQFVNPLFVGDGEVGGDGEESGSCGREDQGQKI
jgi:hypothetical protein